MKTINKIFALVVAIFLTALVLFLAFSAAAKPAFSTTLSELLLRTNTPTPGKVIPLKPIDDLDSLNATVNINVNGLINGERVEGDLNAELTTNEQEKSKASITGSLLGEIAAQVGGSLIGLFTPSTVELYKVPEGAYVVINGLFAVCVKPDAPRAVAALEEISPQNLLMMLTTSDAARGRLVGEEMLNGRRVKHYVIDGQNFLAAARSSADPKLRAFAEGLWAAGDADLYVDAAGGFPVAYRGSFSGAYDPLKFKGLFEVQIALTAVNANTPITLPPSCDEPISM